ncbi:amidohydrolase family protein [Mesorhizobium microcysteis]|uniref:Amidohydrolase family protein n=1 Tax=Neoaquamicrobium microcysteis TaxID=2682781 RepID=A0A5D4H606_9HYPH|nr:amidohydrolase family protein [Mesorhizobium microcysteis]TYR35469.1 amidohydrolase family protein [Mesorhizobium microcysteis]
MPLIRDINMAKSFDLVIRNGRVVDPETGHDAIADVAVSGDQIVAVGPSLGAGKNEIDATGLVVSPGFIDLHAHGQSIPADRMQVFDGVTTALELEVGSLPVARWYQQQQAGGRVLNYGTAAAWIFARKAVMIGMELDGGLAPIEMMGAGSDDMRWSVDAATAPQTDEIVRLTRQALEEGALGIGIPHGYAAGAGVKEMTRICELAAEFDRPTYTHIPYMSNIDPRSSVEAYVQLIGLAGATGAHMHICHLNSTSLRDVEDAARLIAKAQAQGLLITTEAYPYGTGSTVMSARFFIDSDFAERTGTGYGAIQVVSTGKRFGDRDELVAARAQTPEALVLWHYLDTDNPHDQRLLDVSVMYPGGAIASDAVPWSNPDGTLYTGEEWPLPADKTSHPRSAGTYTRFLAQWVREREAVPLVEAIAKCALIPAQIVERCSDVFRRKGRLQPGCDADIVVFDLETVQDRSTFEDMHLAADGMVHVLVNGEAVVANGQLVRDARPGRPIRSTPR